MNTEPADNSSMDPVVTALQHATLRSGVDRSALETFLRAAPEYVAPALSHFSEFPDASAVLDALRRQGAPPEELIEFAQALAPSNDDELLVARIVVDPPAAPHLRTLWDAIEPGGAGFGCVVS